MAIRVLFGLFAVLGCTAALQCLVGNFGRGPARPPPPPPGIKPVDFNEALLDKLPKLTLCPRTDKCCSFIRDVNAGYTWGCSNECAKLGCTPGLDAEECKCRVASHKDCEIPLAVIQQHKKNWPNGEGK